MKFLSKLIFPAIVAASILIIYFTYFASTNEIGSFSKFSEGSEINQQINVAVVKSKGTERDTNGNITAFTQEIKIIIEVRVELHEPAPPEIVNDEVVEVLGRMHENGLVA